MKKTLIISLTALLTAGSVTPAFADPQVDAILGHLGKVCKDKLMTKFPGVSMADLHVTVGATLQESLNNGSMSLKDLQKDGASYNVEVPGKHLSGYCNVSGKGKITDLTLNKN